jgi:hypothetical protein
MANSLNVNHKITMRAELMRLGFTLGLGRLSVDDMRGRLDRCTRWGATALFMPRKAYATPRTIPARFRKV